MKDDGPSGDDALPKETSEDRELALALAEVSPSEDVRVTDTIKRVSGVWDERELTASDVGRFSILSMMKDQRELSYVAAALLRTPDGKRMTPRQLRSAEGRRIAKLAKDVSLAAGTLAQKAHDMAVFEDQRAADAERLLTPMADAEVEDAEEAKPARKLTAVEKLVAKERGR